MIQTSRGFSSECRLGTSGSEAAKLGCTPAPQGGGSGLGLGARSVYSAVPGLGEGEPRGSDGLQRKLSWSGCTPPPPEKEEKVACWFPCITTKPVPSQKMYLGGPDKFALNEPQAGYSVEISTEVLLPECCWRSVRDLLPTFRVPPSGAFSAHRQWRFCKAADSHFYRSPI